MLLLAEHKGPLVLGERTSSSRRREAVGVHLVLCSLGNRGLGARLRLVGLL